MTVPSMSDMRRKAEERIASARVDASDVMPPVQEKSLLHELRVHQVELEMQNEELRQAQAALEAARTRYFDLYDLAPVGYITLSDKNLICEANLRAATLLGIPRGELARQPLARFIESEDQGIFYLHRKRLLETGEAQVCELRMKRPDGEQFWARLDATAARDETADTAVCRVILSDMTERKRAEEERASLLSAELAAREKAEAALRLRDEFITAAAHDLGTPLGALIIQVEGMEQAIQRQRLDPVRTLQGLKLIASQARRIGSLANNLLNLSRYTSDRLDLRRSLCDLEILTREVCERHAPELMKNGGELHLELSAGVTGLWDRSGIEQVIENLLSNAIKFGLGRPMRIEVTAEGDRCRLTMADQGIGIPEDQLTRIFELYARAHSESHYGGLGIGLYVAQKIVSAHGGKLVAEKRPGQGVVFTMDLPRE